MSTLAEDIDSYMRARAAVEGVSYTLNPDFFDGLLKAGIASYFGVEVANGELVRDRQEPQPGFFETWLKSKQNPA